MSSSTRTSRAEGTVAAQAGARRAPLSSLPVGGVGVIVSAPADDVAGRRLLALGFVPGTRVEVIRRAPLGDPIEYALRGYRICLRRADTRHIEVERQEA